jgi:hypothetical protein
MGAEIDILFYNTHAAVVWIGPIEYLSSDRLSKIFPMFGYGF